MYFPSILSDALLTTTVEPGEIAGSRFPHGLYETPSAHRRDTSQSSRSSRSNSGRHARGFAQNQSSPLRPSRDRHMQERLRLRREFDARAIPRGPVGANIGPLPMPRGGRGTGGPGLFPVPSWPAAANTGVYTPNGNGQPGQYSNVVERLSRECQMRHFNLEWQFQTLPSGKLTCHVKLRDEVVRGDGEYECQQTAKVAVASKALAIVQGWPLGGYWSTPGAVPTRPQPYRGALRSGRTVPAVKREGPFVMEAPGHGALTVMAPRGPRRPGDQAALLGHMSRAMGISVPESSRANPEATRAFLEGVAIGTRLARAGISGYSMRDRSRSPVTSRAPSGPSYRARSPTQEIARLKSSPQNRRPPTSPLRLPIRERGRLSPPSVHDPWVHDRYRDDSRPSRD